ncbi:MULTISPECIES: hypothetical protein, partial [Paenibacillus]|uniref:hypothetical protein n=1 Tax=Paenibacillus TaxID=44249 RepID=UPI001BB3F91F
VCHPTNTGELHKEDPSVPLNKLRDPNELFLFFYTVHLTGSTSRKDSPLFFERKREKGLDKQLGMRGEALRLKLATTSHQSFS